MNEQRPLDEQELLLATARVLPPGAALDAETAALRESFLALGAALEADLPPPIEGALMGRLPARCASDRTDERSLSAAEVQKNQVIGIRRDGGRSRAFAGWRETVLVGVVAAAGIVVVVWIVATQPNERLAARSVTTKDNSPAIASDGAAVNHWAAETWHDLLDDELALVAASLGQMSAPPPRFDDSLRGMNQELYWLSQELASGSL